MNVQQEDVAGIDALWEGFSRGEARAQSRLLSLYYEELRVMARRMLYRDAASFHLQPTELTNEAALRVMRLDRIQWRDKVHFLAMSCRVMRQVLLDEVRKFRAAKRQAPHAITTWFDPETHRSPVDVEAVDSALTQLAIVSEERARVVELRFFGGLTIEEIALELDSSPSTVKRQWQAARAWLLAHLPPATA